MTTTAPTAADERPAASDFRWHRAFPLRLHDNDAYGHVNNTIYYAAMDTTVTSWLLRVAGLRLDADVMTVVIASSCRYFASASYPDTFLVGLRADRIGGSSISWGLGIFREDDRELLATGTFTHVFVDRDTRRPTPIPAGLRERTATDLEP